MERSLLRGAQAADPIALNELVRVLSPYVGKICGAIALDDAEDAMQETLTLIVRNIHTLREPAALKAWVRQIAVREATRTARSRREFEDVDEQNLSVDAIDLDTVSDVRAALASLTPEQRAILVLRDLEGYSERDVAQLLAMPEGTVKSRLHRARSAFRRRWEP